MSLASALCPINNRAIIQPVLAQTLSLAILTIKFTNLFQTQPKIQEKMPYTVPTGH
jgi:hypothetical protein